MSERAIERLKHHRFMKQGCYAFWEFSSSEMVWLRRLPLPVCKSTGPASKRGACGRFSFGCQIPAVLILQPSAGASRRCWMPTRMSAKYSTGLSRLLIRMAGRLEAR